VEGLLQRQRGVLLGPGQPRRRRQDREDQQGPPAGRGSPAPGRRALTAQVPGRVLPDFPWDSLEPARLRAAQHPDGVVDLSIGTPVDDTPALLGEALAAAGNAPGYPTALGTAALRTAAAGWLERRLGVTVADPLAAVPSVIPTVGSKELVALLPTLLGLPVGGTVLIPSVAYPTYEVGAVVAGLTVRRTDVPPDDADGVVLVWLNSPGNPHGRVLGDDELRAWVAWGRAHGVPVAADECYVTLGWDVEPRSVLHPAVAGDDHTGLLAVHSLSKQSSAAGYRGGLLSGDPALVRRVWEVRRHLGLLVPTPVQAAITAALGDDAHVDAQRERYRARRDRLATAVRAAGLRIDHSEGGLYLWVTRDEDCWATIDWLAGLGVVAAPGSFYGPSGARHVRMALTATDERIDAAVERLAG
jgi:succinyldiaminopimelate transaminase